MFNKRREREIERKRLERQSALQRKSADETAQDVIARMSQGEYGVQRQDLHCTNCGRHVQFNMDFGLDGNHEITCPDCGHIHYRVVQNGRITEERWNSSMVTYYTTAVTSTATTYYVTSLDNSTSATGTAFLHDLWLQGGA